VATLTEASTNPIQILDLKEQYKQFGPELEKTIIDILRSGNFILGKYVAQLEKDIAAYCGCKHAIGVANGTDALELALWAVGVGPGDEVITPPFTFAATAEAIAYRGATPVFVDVDPKSFNINTAQIERAITPRTKAIMPVHLYGQPANMTEIRTLAERYGVKVVEDNAQAIGATHNGESTGNFGDAACISFYPTKNLGAAGDAGMVVTNDDKVADTLRAIRAHGMRKRYYHDELGRNSRLDEMQAAVLLAKLPFLRTWNLQRSQVASWYMQYLKNCPALVLPAVLQGNTHVWHQYTIRVVTGNATDDAKVRDELAAHLAKRSISSMCYYPVPLHMQEAFSEYGYKVGDFPVSETLANQVLSLPMYPELKEEQVRTVADAVSEFLTARFGVVAASQVVPQAFIGGF
jgi:dTDP-4-amino-4,6-dideoxygalactose transaminase